MDRELELICTQNAQERRLRESMDGMALLQKLLFMQCRQEKKRRERLKQYRWELAGIRVGRFVLLVLSAGLAWMGSFAWAAGGVLIAALFLLAELDRQGKIEELRQDGE